MTNATLKYFPLVATLVVLIAVPAFACGDNSPEKLKKTAEWHFNHWDANENNQLEIEEFLMSEGFNPSHLNDPKIATNFMKEKLKSLPDFKLADMDKSGGLSFDEWVIIRPTSRFMMKC